MFYPIDKTRVKVEKKRENDKEQEKEKEKEKEKGEEEGEGEKKECEGEGRGEEEEGEGREKEGEEVTDGSTPLSTSPPTSFLLPPPTTAPPPSQNIYFSDSENIENIDIVEEKEEGVGLEGVSGDREPSQESILKFVSSSFLSFSLPFFSFSF